MKATAVGVMMVIGVLVSAGCRYSGEPPAVPPQETPKSTGAGDAMAAFWLPAKPEGAMPVKAAIAKKEFDKEVVLVGKVGDIVEGRAAFRLFDLSLKDCNRPDDKCETPWDYCCESSEAILKGSVFVEFKDKDGIIIDKELKGENDFFYLATVIVKGVMINPSDGPSMKATGIYVVEKTALDVAKFK